MRLKSKIKGAERRKKILKRIKDVGDGEVKRETETIKTKRRKENIKRKKDARKND